MGSTALTGKRSVLPMPEADWDEPRFQRWCVATARANGWRVRVMDQRGRPGWRGQPTDKGWPDLLMVKDRVVWIELKDADGQLRPDQLEVIGLLIDSGAEVYIMRPAQWEEFMVLL